MDVDGPLLCVIIVTIIIIIISSSSLKNTTTTSGSSSVGGSGSGPSSPTVESQLKKLSLAKEQALNDAMKLKEDVGQLSQQCQALQVGLEKATNEKNELDKKVR